MKKIKAGDTVRVKIIHTHKHDRKVRKVREITTHHQVAHVQYVKTTDGKSFNVDILEKVDEGQPDNTDWSGNERTKEIWEDHLEESKADFDKAINSMTPEFIIKTYDSMTTSNTIDMGKMHYEGSYSLIDVSCVELKGHFSKVDLLRLAAVMVNNELDCSGGASHEEN